MKNTKYLRSVFCAMVLLGMGQQASLMSMVPQLPKLAEERLKRAEERLKRAEEKRQLLLKKYDEETWKMVALNEAQLDVKIQQQEQQMKGKQPALQARIDALHADAAVAANFLRQLGVEMGQANKALTQAKEAYMQAQIAYRKAQGKAS